MSGVLAPGAPSPRPAPAAPTRRMSPREAWASAAKPCSATITYVDGWSPASPVVITRLSGQEDGRRTLKIGDSELLHRSSDRQRKRHPRVLCVGSRLVDQCNAAIRKARIGYAFGRRLGNVAGRLGTSLATNPPLQLFRWKEPSGLLCMPRGERLGAGITDVHLDSVGEL